MALITIVCRINKCFEFWYIIWVGKVDNIDINVVSFQSLSKLFTCCLIFFNGMTNEYNDSLSLVFVHTMFQ